MCVGSFASANAQFSYLIRKEGVCEEEVYFRDYLNANPKIAKEYEKLKLKLQKKFKYNRDANTEAKTEFVNRVTNLAKQKAIINS